MNGSESYLKYVFFGVNMQNITIDFRIKFDFILYFCTIKKTYQHIREIFMQQFVF
jgi:hypothetical protein